MDRIILNIIIIMHGIIIIVGFVRLSTSVIRALHRAGRYIAYREVRRCVKIRKILESLSRTIDSRYGKKEGYSPEEVKKALRLSRVSMRYAYCGYCAYFTADEVSKLSEKWLVVFPDGYNYDSTRKEIAKCCFKGNENFSVKDVLDFGKSNRPSGKGHSRDSGGEGDDGDWDNSNGGSRNSWGSGFGTCGPDWGSSSDSGGGDGGGE